MAQKSISSSDQRCISECIRKHWSEHGASPSQRRDEAYERCLTNCRICA
jgi:hypothetical protein